MKDDERAMAGRRKVLKGIGTLGVAGLASGLGMNVMTGEAAASEINITAVGPGTVSNDRGDVNQVTIDPEFTVSWSGLDDAVAKVFYLIEAKVGDDGSFVPIFRGTPWLPADVTNNSYIKAKSGTTGEYRLKQPHSAVLNQDDRFWDGEGPDESAGPLVVADENGKPDYSSVDWGNYRQSDLERYYKTGTSMGSATEAGEFLVDEEELVLQNNYRDINAGYYGAASDTSQIDNGNDGTEATTKVTLRYTFELLRPDRGWAESRSGLGDNATKEELAAEIPGIEASDIVDSPSEIVMNGEDGQHSFQKPDSVTYPQMHAHHAKHVGVLVEEAAFQVSAKNEASDSGVSGSSNTGAK